MRDLRDAGTLRRPTGSRAGDDAVERDVLCAAVERLARSQSRVVTVNLEDLWLETQPQNVPGTSDEHPNWRRRARRAFEDFRDAPEVLDTLQAVNDARSARKR